jgi:hypothetical protein
MLTVIQVKTLVTRLFLVYISLLLSSLAYELISVGTIDPEGLAFFVVVDGVIDTLAIIALAYLLSIFDDAILGAGYLVTVAACAQFTLLFVAHHLIRLNLFNFFFVYLFAVPVYFCLLRYIVRGMKREGNRANTVRYQEKGDQAPRE